MQTARLLHRVQQLPHCATLLSSLVLLLVTLPTHLQILEMGDSKSQGNSAGQALSSEGVFYLALLALQFGVQPLLIKEFTSYGLDKSGIVIIGELVKLVACTFMLLKSGEAANALASWKFYDALRCAGLPAVVYSVQNVAIQTAVQNMDGLTFNLLNQSKIIFTAICLYFMMGRKQSIQQCFALLGLFGKSLHPEKLWMKYLHAFNRVAPCLSIRTVVQSFFLES